MPPGVTQNDFDKNELMKSFDNCGSCRHRIGKDERTKRKKTETSVKGPMEKKKIGGVMALDEITENQETEVK